MRANLTTEALPGLLAAPPSGGRDELTDAGPGGVPGLYIERRATSPGEGTYYLRYKANGKTCHQRLGGTRDMTLAEARTAAKKLRAQITLGADPRAEAKAKQAASTLDEFWEQHYRPHAKAHKRSWGRDVQLYRRIGPRFGGMRLEQITRHGLEVFLRELSESGLAPATCNHHIRLLKAMLNRAVEWGMLGRNPASRLPLLHEDNKVEHLLDDAQLERLLRVLRTEEPRTVCSAALFLLATGCRLGEALKARWSDVDLERRVFTVRASNSKSKKVRSVPLNETALEALEGAGTRGRSEYVFANPETGLPLHPFRHTWLRLRRKAGLPRLRLHDLRHQFASLLVNGGRSLYEVQQILGHSSPSVTERYAHLSTRSLQEAASAASAKLGVGARRGA